MQKVAEEGNGTPYFREIRHPMLVKYHYILARMFSRGGGPSDKGKRAECLVANPNLTFILPTNSGEWGQPNTTSQSSSSLSACQGSCPLSCCRC